jgi:hypothetical protein
MFPGLPGDPPLPETGFFLSLVFASAFAPFYVAGAAKPSIKLRRAATRAIAVFAVLAATCAVPIGARNVGRWADLKAELRQYGQVATEYEKEFGRITTRADAERFYQQHPPKSFSFGDAGPRVEIVYLWWHNPGRPGIVFGTGGTAAFHVPTMLCVYSD